MLNTTYWHSGVDAAGRLLGVEKLAGRLDPPDLTPGAIPGPPPDVRMPLRQRLRNWKPSGRMAAGAGLLAGGALLASQLGGEPTMNVVPSAPIAPMFP